MNIIEVSENQCLGWILMHPKLASRSFSMANPRFEDTKSKYISLVTQDEIIGMVKFEQFCQYGMQIHCYLNPKYWGTSKLQESFDLLKKYFRDMGATSLITICPLHARDAVAACRRVGFEEVGRLKKAINWRGRRDDMLILQKGIAE